MKIPHDHEWRLSGAENIFRCLFPLCGGQVTVYQVAQWMDRTGNSSYDIDVIWEELNDTEEETGVEPDPIQGELSRDDQADRHGTSADAGSSDGLDGGEEQVEPGGDSLRVKVCRACGISYTRDNFHRRARSADGLQSVCKSCNSARVKASRAKRRGRALEDATGAYPQGESGLRDEQLQVPDNDGGAGDL